MNREAASGRLLLFATFISGLRYAEVSQTPQMPRGQGPQFSPLVEERLRRRKLKSVRLRHRLAGDLAVAWPRKFRNSPTVNGNPVL